MPTHELLGHAAERTQRRRRNDVVVEDERDRLETIVHQTFRPQLGVIERLQPVPVVVDVNIVLGGGRSHFCSDGQGAFGQRGRGRVTTRSGTN